MMGDSSRDLNGKASAYRPSWNTGGRADLSDSFMMFSSIIESSSIMLRQLDSALATGSSTLSLMISCSLALNLVSAA